MIPFLQHSNEWRLRSLCWAGSARRLSHCHLDERKIRGRSLGRVCLANGSVAFVCTGCLSMVPAVAAAVSRSTSTVPIMVWTLSIIPLIMSGICASWDGRGWFRTGSCCWNTDPWQ